MSDEFWFKNLQKIKKLSEVNLNEKNINLEDEFDFSIINMDMDDDIEEFLKKNDRLLNTVIYILRYDYIDKLLMYNICKKIISHPAIHEDILNKNSEAENIILRWVEGFQELR